MLHLLLQGQWALFLLIVIALVVSLTFHEFGHAAVARLFGDDTAQRAGRLTLNPAAHIDPLGLLMVVLVGFGYARPVPTDPSRYTSRYADLLVSAAGPAMNLAVAFVAVNLYVAGVDAGWGFVQGEGPRFFFVLLAQINLVLMVFNLIPLGALDGHYILPYFLSRSWAQAYRYYNARYGNAALMGLVLLSMVGVPVFRFVMSLGASLLPLITVM
ncbi:MAG: site-2 protease family protein [Candidatus Lambdaproteobacteria bacterium]|nr:site-2 protease family protein [Candidatus Lambdaproteobacteria bacterium]